MEISLKSDLEKLKEDILAELKPYLENLAENKPKEKWLKSKDVRTLLGISAGTLNSLKSEIRHAKVGGTLYWSYNSIQALMERNSQN